MKELKKRFRAKLFSCVICEFLFKNTSGCLFCEKRLRKQQNLKKRQGRSSATEIILVQSPNLFLPPYFSKIQKSVLEKVIFKTLVQVFFCEFCKIFKNIFFTEHVQANASVIRIEKLDNTRLSQTMIFALNLFCFFLSKKKNQPCT